MHVLTLSAPTLAVTLIYVIWGRYVQFRGRQERILRERVCYMLWVMAQQIS